MVEANLDLSTTQLKFHSSKSRFRAMITGLGGGKTFSGCLEAVLTTLNTPNTSGVIVASTYRNMRDFIIPTLTVDLWDALGIPGGWEEYFPSFNKQDLIATAVNGSKIYLRSCDREGDLRGPNLGWFYIDEAARVSLNTWKIMVGRIRKPPERGWLSSTPKGRNWIWDEFVKNPRPAYEWFQGATNENKHLSEAYIESLLESYSGAFLQQEFYGEFTAWEGLVYPQVSVEKHHLDAPEGLGDYKYGIAGCDWGWRDPNVILVGLVGMDGLIHIVDEYHKTKTPIETIAEKAAQLKQERGIVTFWCDPSRPEYIQELRNAGLDARKGKNEIMPGISALTRLIERDLLRVDFNKAPELARELEVYHYPETDTGELIKDRPVDKDNHCLDSLRYMTYSLARQGHASSTRGFR